MKPPRWETALPVSATNSRCERLADMRRKSKVGGVEGIHVERGWTTLTDSQFRDG